MWVYWGRWGERLFNQFISLQNIFKISAPVCTLESNLDAVPSATHILWQYKHLKCTDDLCK